MFELCDIEIMDTLRVEPICLLAKETCYCYTISPQMVKHGRIRTSTWAAQHRLLIYLKLHASLKLWTGRESNSDLMHAMHPC